MCLCVHVRVPFNYTNLRTLFSEKHVHGRSMNCKAAVTSALHVVVEVKVRMSCPHQSPSRCHCIQTSIHIETCFSFERASHLSFYGL